MELVTGATGYVGSRLLRRLAREGRPATRVGVKIRFRPFITRQRSLTLPSPSSDPTVITGAVADLLGRFERSRPVRLVGVSVTLLLPEGD